MHISHSLGKHSHAGLLLQKQGMKHLSSSAVYKETAAANPTSP